MMCLMVGMYLVFVCVTVLFGRTDSRTAACGLVALVMYTPVILAMSMGPVLGRFSADRGSSEMPSFLATRPTGLHFFVAAKFRMAAKSTLITAAITLACYALLSIPIGGWQASVRWWSALAAAYSPLGAALIVVLALVVILVVTWGLGVQGMWLAMTGRQWPLTTVGVLVLPVFFGSLFGYLWLIAHPEQMRIATNLAPWAAVAAATVKLALAGWLARVLLKQRLVDADVVKRVGAVWLAAFAVFTAAACWLVPAALAPWHATVSCVVLLLPTLGIELAPLALAWNRHR